MRPGASLARLQRQAGLGAVEGLDLALFVDREDQAVGRRVDVQPDDLAQLLGERRIVRALEGPETVRLEVVLGPAAGSQGRPPRSPRSAARCTELREMPACLAIARPVQWVASPGGSAQVIATTRATVSAGSGGVPGGRVLSRSRPLTPCSANRRCQRHTAGRLTPARLATSATASRAADSSTSRARCTCLWLWLRSLTIASSRARSSSLTITETSCAMLAAWHRLRMM